MAMKHTAFLALSAGAALSLTAPASAQMPLSPEGEVEEATAQFFAAIRNPDKTALREMMVPEGVIFIHNQMDPANSAVVVLPVLNHLATWEGSNAATDERMAIASLNVEGDMAHVWGPYRFMTRGQTSHCGVNSLSFVKTDNDGWKVANTSFSMVAPSQCDAIGAPEAWS